MTRPGTTFFLNERKAFYSTEQDEDGNISASLFQTERFIDHAPAYSCMNCANGLFCVWEPSTMRSAVIFNSSTREVRFFPHPNIGTSCGNYLIDFEPQENKYKVFISKKLSGYIKQWIQSICPSITNYKPSVCLNGVIYQFVSAHKCVIATFDVKSENFEIIKLWNESTWVYYYHLIVVKEKYDSSCTSCDGKIVLIRNFKSGVLCWCYDVIATRRRWKKIRNQGRRHVSMAFIVM
ncbi:hypothetical protein R3W88_000580 [Solanum pinnatisectum]|uniref:F-box associated beta-propeller type 3 domain-containing protein n=1 Tax=Solanum pinnatisectum TaxID=50273 RepID=A0AAV9MFZ9_9SOLN|nr:hypothetical protein R3W88_000580 [Solanum pinnatisectum]